ncbi:MAG: hypothetical protein ACYC0V_01880 [Armatimonadota bacterium]
MGRRGVVLEVLGKCAIRGAHDNVFVGLLDHLRRELGGPVDAGEVRRIEPEPLIDVGALCQPLAFPPLHRGRPEALPHWDAVSLPMFKCREDSFFRCHSYVLSCDS